MGIELTTVALQGELRRPPLINTVIKEEGLYL